jgi:UDP-glucose 4-epimerase
MRRILVTGAGTWAGGRLVQRLEQMSGTTVFPVDAVDPRVPFDSEFFRTSLDQLPFAAYLLDSAPDTVIHLQTLDRSAEIGRARSHEQVVVGAQALFGAILRCRQVRHVIVKSGSDVYGATSRSPSVHPEDEGAGSVRRSRYQRDLIEVEDFVREMAGRQPDVSYTILRLAPILGPNIGNALSRYVRLPVVPTIAGFDPRMQFLYEEDAVGSLLYAATHPIAGTFNVAGSGQLYLSRVLRLGLRPSQPLPRRAFKAAARGLSRLDITLLPHLIALLEHGRVMETRRMRSDLGFHPRLNCRQTVLATYRRLPDSALPEEFVTAYG